MLIPPQIARARAY